MRLTTMSVLLPLALSACCGFPEHIEQGGTLDVSNGYGQPVDQVPDGRAPDADDDSDVADRPDGGGDDGDGGETPDRPSDSVTSVKPGYGHGDKNHAHTGPRGKAKGKRR